jgi:SAM-dependent methyltransferase
MGDYTNMSAYYDAIMTSGYYDYKSIVDNLLQHESYQHVLEIGCGTGLILEELANRKHVTSIMGVDLTQSMLEIAQDRLKGFPNVQLSNQDVTKLALDKQYGLVFSYGGVWYFVIDGDNEPFLVSHIPDAGANEKGFEHLTKYVNHGGTLLLGIQGPHHDYEKVISNGMTYSQKIDHCEDGFIKHYYLADKGNNLMAQTTQYRTYDFASAQKLLKSYGFEYQKESHKNKLFLRFKKI